MSLKTQLYQSGDGDNPEIESIALPGRIEGEEDKTYSL